MALTKEVIVKELRNRRDHQKILSFAIDTEVCERVDKLCKQFGSSKRSKVLRLAILEGLPVVEKLMEMKVEGKRNG